MQTENVSGSLYCARVSNYLSNLLNHVHFWETVYMCLHRVVLCISAKSDMRAVAGV